MIHTYMMDSLLLFRNFPEKFRWQRQHRLQECLCCLIFSFFSLWSLVFHSGVTRVLGRLQPVSSTSLAPLSELPASHAITVLSSSLLLLETLILKYPKYNVCCEIPYNNFLHFQYIKWCRNVLAEIRTYICIWSYKHI